MLHKSNLWLSSTWSKHWQSQYAETGTLINVLPCFLMFPGVFIHVVNKLLKTQILYHSLPLMQFYRRGKVSERSGVCLHFLGWLGWGNNTRWWIECGVVTHAKRLYDTGNGKCFLQATGTHCHFNHLLLPRGVAFKCLHAYLKLGNANNNQNLNHIKTHSETAFMVLLFWGVPHG